MYHSPVSLLILSSNILRLAIASFENSASNKSNYLINLNVSAVKSPACPIDFVTSALGQSYLLFHSISLNK